MRILIVCILIVAAVVLPWWVAYVAALLAALSYPRFYAIVVPMLWMDLLFGAHPIFGIPGFATVTVGGALLLRVIAESRLRDTFHA